MSKWEGTAASELEARRLAKIAEHRQEVPWDSPDADPIQDMHEVAKEDLAKNLFEEDKPEPLVRIWPETIMRAHGEYVRQWLLSVLVQPTEQS